MANQPPPPFGSYDDQAQPWPFPFPPMVLPTFATNSDILSNIPPMLLDPSQAFQFGLAGMNPSLGTPVAGNRSGGSIPQPTQFPIAGPYDFSQLQLPLHQMGPAARVHGALGPNAVPGSPADARAPHMLRPGTRKPEVLQNQSDSDQTRDNPPFEEGEISEGEIGLESRRMDAVEQRSGPPVAKRQRQQHASTISSPSSSSSQSSAPYNPPLSVSMDSQPVDSAPELQRNSAATIADGPESSQAVPHLRVQAQGALLSLAIHNIRFNELVAEGINPSILRKLYEEVGIRVEASQPPTPTVKVTAESVTKLREDHAESRAVPKSMSTNAPQPGTVQSAPKQPMERKELIAKMLAAKAASKPSENAAPSPSPSSAEAEIKTKESIVPTKEKSKAQTELARQRIEELKKQALLRSKLKAQQDAQDAQHSQNVPSNPSPVVNHPLPVRPPVPHNSSTAAIPGLSLTEHISDGGSKGADEGIDVNATDSTSLDRLKQRKRPRASDLDDSGEAENGISTHVAAPLYKESDRLIIHISDDESLYGDDEDEEMDADSSSESETPNKNSSTAEMTASQPVLRRSASGTGASSTPQVSVHANSDQEQMRRKALEIQALHRRIAELEERRKAKLAASRTQSPHPATTAAGTPSASGAASNLPEDRSPEDQATEEVVTQLAAKRSPLAAQEDSPKLTVSRKSPDTPSSDVPVTIPTQEESSLGRSPMSAGSALLQEESEDASSGNSSSEDSSSDDSGSEDSNSEESGSEESQLESGADVSASENPVSDDSSTESQSEQEDGEMEDSETYEPPNTVQLVPDDDSMEVDRLPNRTSEGGAPVQPAVSREVKNPHGEDDEDYEPTDLNGNDLDMSDAASISDSEVYEPPEPETGPGSPQSSYSPPPPDLAAEPMDVDHLFNSSQSHDSQNAMPRMRDQEAQPVYRGPESQILGINTPSNATVPNFTSYVSPLRYFKAYRYHPHYTEEVSDGYRSLTFSNDICPMRYLCKYEISGGSCNDHSCQFQHFRDMSLSDDQILIEMGAVREGKTDEEKEAYLAGLKGIINDMRRDKVKDFSTVASEIAAYRRRFLQDPSRVLPL
ncbi:Uncharacterized protein PECH_005879 [Penicillium ucsense]|uniref:Putative zinc-finger domain-containing protein n=1 Tax=Penicillium ucsense TaxID=2839758 RepID=A0A8J8WAQ0_9EURO|nr:Uncharacterized protein PECM_000707 [Penicillium ucsense]KAF7736068.1 Uncharacterized protein PECH_005879 [Penicillium ucsense]